MKIDHRYSEMRAATRVREQHLLLTPRIPNELELQARWFAGDFGRNFVSSNGDKIEIVQFGTWNRESGPDFRDAAIRINDGEPMRGCIEIDLVDRNWETHGHATNDAFEDTVLHLFVQKSDREFFTRTKSNRNVPQVRLDLAKLPDAFRDNLPLAHAGRCQAPLRNLPADRVDSVLEAAARFRLQRKSSRLRNKIDSRQSKAGAARTSEHGEDEALFQEIATALGYKENTLPFMLLAQRLPLKFLRAHSPDAEALVFGVAGFLESRDRKAYKKSTREYVRDLWDRWWRHREQFQRIILPPTVWRITSTRPSNHPQRRLAALTSLVREWSAFRRSLGKADLKDAESFFDSLDHPFWNFHYTLQAEPSSKEMALVGTSRIADIFANVLFPLWLVHGVDLWSEYSKLPARLTNRRLETGAARLFGDDPRQKKFLKTVAHQQGLLQIYEDFCLQDNSDCAQCPFPEQMQKWK